MYNVPTFILPLLLVSSSLQPGQFCSFSLCPSFTYLLFISVLLMCAVLFLCLYTIPTTLFPTTPLPLSFSLSFSLSFCLSVLSFCLDSRWGLHAERVALGKGQTYARSVPGLTLLQAADRALTSFHLTSDLLVADVSITQGRHYWACSVEPGSYLVKVSS